MVTTNKRIGIGALLSAAVISTVFYFLPGSDKGVFKGDGSNVKPGDTIKLKGDYSYVYLNNFHGDSLKPIVIINEGLVNLSAGFSIGNSTDLKIIGSGDSRYKYGFVIKGRGADGNNSVGIDIHDKSARIEISHFQLSATGYGLWFKNESFTDKSLSDWVLRDLSVHDFEMFDLNQHGFYIGATEQENKSRPNEKGEYINPSRIGNVTIYNGYIHNVGKNGVMVNDVRFGLANIYNMRIDTAGRLRAPDQGTGISIGGYSNAWVHDNQVQKTWLWNIAAFGPLSVDIERNTTSQAGWSTGGLQAWPNNIMVNTGNRNGVQFFITDNQLSQPGSGAASIALYPDGGSFTPGSVLCRNTISGKIEASGFAYVSDCSSVPVKPVVIVEPFVKSDPGVIVEPTPIPPTPIPQPSVKIIYATFIKDKIKFNCYTNGTYERADGKPLPAPNDYKLTINPNTGGLTLKQL